MSGFVHVETEHDCGRAGTSFLVPGQVLRVLSVGDMWTVLRQAPRSAVGGYG